MLNPPRGIRAELATDFCCGSQCQCWGTCPTLPPYGRIWVLLPYYYTSFKPGTPFTDVENRSELEILFNNPGPLVGATVQKLKDGRDAIFQPMPWRRFGPVQLYERGDVYAFLTRGDRPLWLPVSQGDFLEAKIAERDSQFGNALMYVTDARMLADARPNSPEARPLVSLNPNFFDRAPPRTDIQRRARFGRRSPCGRERGAGYPASVGAS